MFGKVGKFKKSIFIGAAFIIILAGSYFRWLDTVELISLDTRFKSRGKVPQSSDIGIIEIGDDSINQLGRWPFDRKLHAYLIRILSKYKARMVGFDIVFNQTSASDPALAAATKNAGNVYYPEGKFVDIIPSLKAVARGTGHINITPDRDGKRRHIAAFIPYKNKLQPQFAVKMAADYLKLSPQDLKIPLNEEGKILINYAGRWKETYKHYSYVDILTSFEQINKGLPPRINLKELKDMVFFVGLSATGTTDIYPIPLESNYPMVGVNVNIFNSIVNNDYLRRESRINNLLALVFLLFLGMATLRRFTPVKAVILLSCLLIAYTAFCFFIFDYRGLWLDLVYPVFVLVLVSFFFIYFGYLKERGNRLLLEHDLEIAGNIQQSFLPRSSQLKFGTLEIVARMISSRHVGGDFYDLVELAGENLGVLIGDVSGKGIPASLYMALSVTTFRPYLKVYQDPAKVLGFVNEELRQRHPKGVFVTSSYLILDREGKGRFASAGHLPLILSCDSELKYLQTQEGLPLGIADKSYFSQSNVELNRGDIIILFTDGITEAKDKGGEVFGIGRLESLIKDNRFLAAPLLAGQIIEAIEGFSKPCGLADDLTIIAIKRN